jgi:hypothetical protein
MTKIITLIQGAIRCLFTGGNLSFEFPPKEIESLTSAAAIQQAQTIGDFQRQLLVEK